MRESRTYGFVRGVLGDRYPYRDSHPLWDELSLPSSSIKRDVKRNSSPLELKANSLGIQPLHRACRLRCDVRSVELPC